MSFQDNIISLGDINEIFNIKSTDEIDNDTSENKKKEKDFPLDESSRVALSMRETDFPLDKYIDNHIGKINNDIGNNKKRKIKIIGEDGIFPVGTRVCRWDGKFHGSIHKANEDPQGIVIVRMDVCRSTPIMVKQSCLKLEYVKTQMS